MLFLHKIFQNKPMNFPTKSLTILILTVTGIMLLPSCQKDPEEQDKRAQEQRFFDLYVGKNYPNVLPDADNSNEKDENEA